MSEIGIRVSKIDKELKKLVVLIIEAHKVYLVKPSALIKLILKRDLTRYKALTNDKKKLIDMHQDLTDLFSLRKV